ncbi:serine hydrolase [Streptomyces sp. NPDC005963]|uniref:D-alanyl-D-alanine carboxypeptidase n=1 Tax=Streptomyces sp. NPDC005963 TaxID=3156721 RepID=UPI00340B65F4
MAGESPDRSEQRKSSGETTEGERDPRLAMLGRASASEVDQPTAVFRLPDEPKPSGAAGRKAPDSGVRQQGTETGSVQSDAELRSAVAAWVASVDHAPAAEADAESAADTDTDTDTDSGGTGKGKGAGAERTALLPQSREASADERTAVLPEADRDGAEIGTTTGGTTSRTAGDRVTLDKAGAPVDSGEADGDEANDGDAEGRASAVADDEPAKREEAPDGARRPAAGASRPAASVTAPRGASGSTKKPSEPSTATSADTSETGPAAETASGASGPGTSTDLTKRRTGAGEGTGTPQAPKADGSETRDPKGAASAAGAARTDSGAGGESDADSRTTGAGRTPGTPSWAARATTEPSPSGTPSAAEAAERAPGRTPAAGTPARTAPAEAKSSDTSTDGPSGGSGHRTAKSSTEDRPKADASPKAGTPASRAGTPASKGGSATGPADASTGTGPAVDQPTAVFKALRKPGEAATSTSTGSIDGADSTVGADKVGTAKKTDNTTASLKAPPAPRPESDPSAKDSPSPRPSTFVPLRSDDGPRTPVANKTGTAAPADRDRVAGGPPAGAPAGLSEPERTTQQPVPPLPPLDLLAELTNTPPPPDTAVRTLIRRVKIWTPLLAVLLIVFAIVQVLRPLPAPTLKLSTDPTFTFQGDALSLPFPGEGQGAVAVDGVGTVATYGAQRPAPIASVAKTMTAYVILKEHPITGKQVGPKITVDQQTEDESKNTDESRVPVSKGQKFTQREMLEMVMIHSANNVARLLARWDAGTEQAFVKKMNDAAKELGMADTLYTDPSGLQETTVSTPQDQLKLAQAVMKNDIFREIVNTTMKEIPGVGIPLRNGNDRALLEDGVGGIKTGSSTPAGGNLLWAANAEVDGELHQIVGVTLGVQDAKLLKEKVDLAIDHSINVIAATQQAVTSAVAVKKGQVVGYVDDGLGGRTAVVAAKDLKAIGWAGHRVSIEINDGGKKLPGAAKSGQIVGQISVGTGPGKVTAPIELQQELAEPGFGAKLTRLG